MWARLLALAALALFPRVYACSQLKCISRDGVHFVSFARQLASDPVKAMKGTSKQPGMSFLLVGVNRALGGQAETSDPQRWLLAGHVVAVTGGVASCLLIYALARMLFSAEIALLAGLLACFWPQGVGLSADVLSDMPHLALYLAALVVGFRAIRLNTLWAAALSGILGGMAYWMRQEALGVMLAIGVGLLWSRGSVTLGRRIGQCAVLGLSFLAVVGPQAYLVGDIMPNKDIWQMLFGQSSTARNQPGGLILAEVLPWWKAPGRIVEHWAFSGRYILSGLVLAALFLRSAPVADRTRALIVASCVMLQLFAIQLRVKSYGEMSSRYVVILVALSIPWSAAGLYALTAIIQRRATQRPGLIVGIILLLIFAPLTYFCTRPVGPEGIAYREAGSWLGARAGQSDRIAGHSGLEQLMFYAGRILPDERWVRLPSDALASEIALELGSQRLEWFVDAVNSRKLDATADAKYFQELSPLGDPIMREVHRTSLQTRQAIIWQIRKFAPTQPSRDR